MAGKGGASETEGPGTDRDVVDFSWLTSGLRRLKLLGPPRPQPDEQLRLFGAPPAPGAAPDLVMRLRARLAGTPGASPAPRSASGGSAAEAPPAPADGPIAADYRARVLVAIAVVAYVVIFTRWMFRNQDGLGTQAYDLGIFDQGVWLLSRFHRPFITINGRNLFGDHTSFILLPWAAVYWLFPTAKALLFGQAAALGAGAVATFLLAREKLRTELLSALLAVAYLLQPVLGWTDLEQFHPDVFEVPLVIFAFWFLVRKRWVGYFVCVGALLLVKEDVGLLTFGLGVYVALRHDRRVGLITCAVSAAYMAIAFWLVIPAFLPGGTVYTGRIPFGGPLGFVSRTINQPGDVVRYLWVHKRGLYLWQLAAPLGLVALLAPAELLVVTGPLALNLISSFPYQYDIHFHYSTLILPVLVVATIFGVASHRLRGNRGAAVGLVLVASLIGAHLWGPTPLGEAKPFVANPHTAAVASFHQAEAMIPPKAIISVYYGWVPQLDHRTEIYMFPNPFQASYWGNFKQEGQRLPQSDRIQYVLLPSTLDPQPKAVLDSISSQFETIYASNGVTLIKRRSA